MMWLREQVIVSTRPLSLSFLQQTLLQPHCHSEAEHQCDPTPPHSPLPEPSTLASS